MADSEKMRVAQDNAAFQQGVADRKAGRPMMTAGEFASSHPTADADDYPFYTAGYKGTYGDLEVEQSRSEHRKDYSQAQRDEMAKNGQALPDGSFPIADKGDLSNAIQAYGRASDKPKAKAHIMKRAKALGATEMLPDDWTSSSRSAGNRRRSSSRSREVRFMDREIRQTEGDDGRTVLRGMVIRYGVPYEVRDEFGTFTETIERGAAADVLKANPDVRFLFNHDGMPLARTLNGSLTLRDLPEGVEVEARLDPNMPSAQDVIHAVSSGLISQMSVGMVVGADVWNDQMDRRSISRLKGMPDVSAVTYPASPTTSIEAVRRSLDANPELRAQIEQGDDVLPSARLDKIAAEVRAGKTLSNATASVLVGMAQNLHDLLASGGADFSHSPAQDDADDTMAEPEGTDVIELEDGTEDESTEMVPDQRSDAIDLELRQLLAEQELAELALS